MFSDPQTITVNAVAQVMPRVETNGKSATYRKADETFTLFISHLATAKDRLRSLVKFTEKAVVTNPLDSSNDYDTCSLQIVLDRPSFGFTSTRVDQLRAGLLAWFDSAACTKFFGGES